MHGLAADGVLHTVMQDGTWQQLWWLFLCCTASHDGCRVLRTCFEFIPSKLCCERSRADLKRACHTRLQHGSVRAFFCI